MSAGHDLRSSWGRRDKDEKSHIFGRASLQAGGRLKSHRSGKPYVTRVCTTLSQGTYAIRICQWRPLASPLPRTEGLDMTDDALPAHEEFERRFLVDDKTILESALTFEHIQQAYLWAEGGYAVRVRITKSSDPEGDSPSALLTLKGPREHGHRYEVEVPIDLQHAEAIVKESQRVITKRRHQVLSEEDLWEIDVFDGDCRGLVVAEYEASEGLVGRLKAPWWAGREVTQLREYDNERLASQPRRQ